MSDGMAKAGAAGIFILMIVLVASANAETVVNYLIGGVVVIAVVILAIFALGLKGPDKGIYK